MLQVKIKRESGILFLIILDLHTTNRICVSLKNIIRIFLFLSLNTTLHSIVNVATS